MKKTDYDRALFLLAFAIAIAIGYRILEIAEPFYLATWISLPFAPYERIFYFLSCEQTFIFVSFSFIIYVLYDFFRETKQQEYTILFSFLVLIPFLTKLYLMYTFF